MLQEHHLNAHCSRSIFPIFSWGGGLLGYSVILVVVKLLWRRNLYPIHVLTGKFIPVPVQGIGDIHAPTAVHIESDRHTGVVEVVVIEDLGYDVLLGRELDSWDDVNPLQILMLTRAQKQQQVWAEIIAQDTMREYMVKQNER